MAHIRNSLPRQQSADRHDYLLTEDECAKEVDVASGGKLVIRAFYVKEDSIPPRNETVAESTARLETMLREIQARHVSTPQSVLVVTHGDTLQAAAQAFLGPSISVYDLDFCALAVFDSSMKLCHHRGLKMLEMA